MLSGVAGRAQERLTYKILVVDDEPGMRKSVAVMLRREGYQVAETGSVADAMGRLQEEPYNLVITDLVMMPLSGLDLLALVRRYRSECPVMIISGFGTAEARSEAERLGAVDFLDKPLEAPALLLRIREILLAREHDRESGDG